MNRNVYEQLLEKYGWKPVPTSTSDAPASPAKILGVKCDGNVAYVSGHVAFSAGELLHKGRIGQDVSIEDGKKSAALSTLNCLLTLDSAVGLENVDSILKVTGYLSCAEDVTDHPSIMNAASDVLIDIFGEQGMHARAALGIHTLPLGASTEVDMIVKLTKSC